MPVFSSDRLMRKFQRDHHQPFQRAVGIAFKTVSRNTVLEELQNWDYCCVRVKTQSG